MSKSGSRKSESKNPGPKGRAPLSPEEADRAAAAFVPLWQFDEAPFTASPATPSADVKAVAFGKTTLIGMQLGPAPVLSAAAPAAPAAAAPSEQQLLESRSTVKMTPLHLPNAERAADPDLPSVIVEPGTPAAAAVEADIVTARSALRDHKTVPVRVSRPAAPPDAPPSEKRGPKTIPPTSRARSAPRPRPAPDAEDLAGAGYTLPRSRAPLMIGGGIAGSALLIFAVYAISSASSSPAAPAPTTVTHTDPSPRTDPGPAIPPPPPADEPPVAAAAPPPPAPPPPAAAAPAPAPAPAPPPAPIPDPQANIPVATPATLPAAPPIHHAAPPPPQAAAAPPPPKPAAAPPTHPAKPRNPPPAPAAGGIVRDNPF